MRTTIYRVAMVMLLLPAAGAMLHSCKSKPKEVVTAPASEPAPGGTVMDIQVAPVVVATEDSLTTGAKDAIKDFPGVNVAVNEGVLTLTGEIKKDRLPTLMKSLNTLRPKKIVNQLTIK